MSAYTGNDMSNSLIQMRDAANDAWNRQARLVDAWVDGEVNTETMNQATEHAKRLQAAFEDAYKLEVEFLLSECTCSPFIDGACPACMKLHEDAEIPY